MVVAWNAEIVDQIDSHWRHQFRPRLDGLTDAEYFWQPAPKSPDAERVTTIAWRLSHLVVGLAETNGTHFGGPPADVGSFDYATTAEEALHQLDGAYEAWLAGVRSLGEAGLTRPQGPTSPPQFANEAMARLIMYTSVELIHHGAEVCLLRDLYRSAGAGVTEATGVSGS